jgi:hypothetical protein
MPNRNDTASESTGFCQMQYAEFRTDFSMTITFASHEPYSWLAAATPMSLSRRREISRGISYHIVLR